MLGFAYFPTVSRAFSVCSIEFRSETQQFTTLNPTYIPPAPKSVITRMFERKQIRSDCFLRCLRFETTKSGLFPHGI